MTYIIPKNNHPADCYQKLVKLQEFEHLEEAQIEWLLVADPIIRAGRQVLGEVHLPKVQGRLNGVFQWMLAQTFAPDLDFLVLLDADYWTSGSDKDREILVFHELCHCHHAVDGDGEPRYDDDTGRPVYDLIAHDVEEFTATVARYGAYSEDIKRFVGACGGG